MTELDSHTKLSNMQSSHTASDHMQTDYTKAAPPKSRRASMSPRQQSILDAALVCFTHHGLEATTIEMIRDESGASVGSIYHHFKNKEGIAAALYREGMRQFSHDVQRTLKEVSDIEWAIRQIVEITAEWISQHRDWARFIFQERQILTAADQEAAFGQDVQTSHQVWAARMAALPDASRLYPMPTSLYFSILVGPVLDYGRRWLRDDTLPPPREVAPLLVQAAQRSLLRPASGNQTC